MSTPRAAAATPARQRQAWWIHIAVAAGLLAANLLLYRSAVHLGFLSVDDPDYVQNDPYIGSFSSSNLVHIFSKPYAANYAPFNLLSYALDVKLAGGRDPQAIHLSSIFWHGANVCAVYLLGLAIFRHLRPAVFAALLFMVHPAHVEVVAWISSRKDLVATGFAVLAMAAYILYARRDKHRWLWYCGSVACFFIASGAKQSVLLLPAVMLLWDLLVQRRRQWEMLLDKIPFAAATLFFGWMTWHAQPPTGQHPDPFIWAASELINLWLLSGCGQYTLYRLAPNGTGISAAGRVLLMLAALALWLLPLLWLRKQRQPLAVVCSYWVLIQLIPPMLLSFIVPITDRYLFLPSVGVCLLLGLLSEQAAKFFKVKLVFYFIGALIAGVWTFKTISYLREWNDPRSVWYAAHNKTKNPQVSQFLGEVYQNAGDRIDAFFKTGAGLDQTNETPLAAAVLAQPERTQRLIEEWRGQINSRTNSVAYRDQLWGLAWQQYEEAGARRGTLSTPNLFMNRGRLLVSEGKYREAIPEFQIALNFARNSKYDVIRNESSTHALRSIGVAYWHLRQYDEALKWYEQAETVQTRSGVLWIPTLEQEIGRLKNLAASQH